MDEGDNLILLGRADEGGEELCCREAALDISELDKGSDTVESPDREELSGESAAERSEKSPAAV